MVFVEQVLGVCGEIESRDYKIRALFVISAILSVLSGRFVCYPSYDIASEF